MSNANSSYYDECKKQHGSVRDVDGTEYALTQDAYISDDGNTYEASVVSMDMLNEAGTTPDDYNPSIDPAATAYWEIICDDCDDQSNACDWDKPLVIKLS